jgi:hypothetical protein
MSEADQNDGAALVGLFLGGMVVAMGTLMGAPAVAIAIAAVAVVAAGYLAGQKALSEELNDFDAVSLVTDPDQNNNNSNDDSNNSDSNNNGDDGNNGDSGDNGDNGVGDGDPVALDLDGNGIELIRRNFSMVTFDLDHDGYRERTAWVGPHDGILVIDLAADGSAGPDGKIDQDREMIFTRWSQSATSDMAALREVFDTNHNGKLDAGDARFSEFRVWQDANQNGRTDPGELKTLAELGIASIDLQPHGAPVASATAARGPTASPRLRVSTGRTASRPTSALPTTPTAFRPPRPRTASGSTGRMAPPNATLFPPTPTLL